MKLQLQVILKKFIYTITSEITTTCNITGGN